MRSGSELPERDRERRTEIAGEAETAGQAGAGAGNPVNTEQWILRPGQESDLDQIAAMEAAVFSNPWSRKSCQEILGQKRYCVLVLAVPRGEKADRRGQGWEGSASRDTQGQEILGYVCGMSVLEEGELHRIAVMPAWRGKGYGQLLLQAFLETMKGRGVTAVYLEVRAGNGPAIRLYERNDFERIGIRKAYYQNPREDAQIMQKMIG